MFLIEIMRKPLKMTYILPISHKIPNICCTNYLYYTLVSVSIIIFSQTTLERTGVLVVKKKK